MLLFAFIFPECYIGPDPVAFSCVEEFFLAHNPGSAGPSLEVQLTLCGAEPAESGCDFCFNFPGAWISTAY